MERAIEVKDGLFSFLSSLTVQGDILLSHNTGKGNFASCGAFKLRICRCVTTKLALFHSEKRIQTDLTTPSILQGWVWRPKSSWPIWTSTTSWCWPGPSSTCITPLKAPCRGPPVTTCGTQVSPADQRPVTTLPLYTRLGVIYHLLFAFSTSSKARENGI